jgi:hypothetical protein
MVFVACAGAALSPAALFAKPPAEPAAAAPKKPDAPGQSAGAEAAPMDDLKAQAAARKQAGDQAMEALRYADALAAYTDVYAVTKDPALLYNMGRALQALNRFPEALEKLTAFEAAASPELKARVPRLPKLIADIRERVTTLTIRTNIEGARILVRNTVVGRAPLEGPLKLVAGPAEIEIEAEGYFTAKKSLELRGGTEQDVNLELFSKITTGVLQVRASVPAAEVLVDGRKIGNAPVELNVTKGSHRVTVRHRDYRLYETTAIVPAGGSKMVTATLDSSSVLTRWWFWSGAGAIVTAGVVLSIAAVTERSPDAGTIAPGQISSASASVGATLVSF